MKKIYLLIIVIIIAILGWIFLEEEEITNADSTGTDIVAFGDSLVYGLGSTDGGFVSILEEKIRESIINLGVMGDTTEMGLARVKTLDKYKPKVVILLLGGNDYLRKVPEDQTFKNLEKIIDEIHARGSMVLLLGIQGGVLKDNYEARFEDLAEKKGTAYVPNVLDNIIYDRTLMSDAVHPNDLGYERIAEKIKPKLEKLLK